MFRKAMKGTSKMLAPAGGNQLATHIKPYTMMKALLIVYILSFFSCTQEVKKNNNISDNQKISQSIQENYTLLHTFHAKDGKVLGSAYVKYIDNREIFTSLLNTKEEKGKQDTLYFIDSTRLNSKKGIDTEVVKEDFHGYKTVLKKGDYIVLVLVNEYGEGASDNLTIEWNYEEDLFELMKTP